jgi:protein-S-isoprenylcysteine O-methyltransferase Ste14
MVVVGSRHLGPSLTPFPAPLPGASLRQDGLYRVVRHPIYGGGLGGQTPYERLREKTTSPV